MDISSFKRDPSRVKQALVQKGDRVIAKQACKITIPAYYANRGMAELGLDVYITAIYAIVLEDGTYATSIVPAMMRIKPSSTSKATIGEMEYLVFGFEAGDTVIDNTNLVKVDTLVYPIFNEILGKGLVPWWMTYDDVGRLLSNAKEFAGTNIGENREAVEVLISMLARDPEDRSLQYRHTLKNFAQVESRPPVFSPIRSVHYLASNTLSKLAGSHFSKGMVSALVNPTEREERIERILTL